MVISGAPPVMAPPLAAVKSKVSVVIPATSLTPAVIGPIEELSDPFTKVKPSSIVSVMINASTVVNSDNCARKVKVMVFPGDATDVLADFWILRCSILTSLVATNWGMAMPINSPSTVALLV